MALDFAGLWYEFFPESARLPEIGEDTSLHLAVCALLPLMVGGNGELLAASA